MGVGPQTPLRIAPGVIPCFGSPDGFQAYPTLSRYDKKKIQARSTRRPQASAKAALIP